LPKSRDSFAFGIIVISHVLSPGHLNLNIREAPAFRDFFTGRAMETGGRIGIVSFRQGSLCDRHDQLQLVRHRCRAAGSPSFVATISRSNSNFSFHQVIEIHVHTPQGVFHHG